MIDGALHHASIIVPDEQRAIDLAELFGLKLGRRQFVAEYEADCIFTTGDTGIIEFIIAKAGKLAKFNKGMGGLHHIAIEVPDLPATRRALAEKGIPTLEQAPVAAGPIEIDFVAPAYTRGVIVEYVQRTASTVGVRSTARSAPEPKEATPDASRPSEDELFKQVRELRKRDEPAAAAAKLRDGLRRGWFSPEALERVGRQLSGLFEKTAAPTLRVLVLGQCTTHWVGSCLVAAAWAEGHAVSIADGQYDNVMQELLAASATDVRYDAVVLVPWNERLLAAAAEDAASRIASELGFWQEAWQIVTSRMGSRLIQVGYDWVVAGPLGQHLGGRQGGNVQRVRRMNEALRTALPESSYFVDLDQSAGIIGRDGFYDPRRYAWTKQPFSEAGAAALAKQVWAGVRALVAGPKKVLVLDLDNTLWGGVVGEVGATGIECGDATSGEAFKAFQNYVKALGRRGVLLAVSSKNNPADAREPFETNSSLPLKLEDFAAFECNWEPKSQAIERIAQTLRLGLDSFVFFDDNPAEREHVRQMLPEVEVVEVPEDPAHFIRALEAGQWFEAAGLTAEDRERTEQYRAEAERRNAQSTFATMEDYLLSLQMVGEAIAIGDADIGRVVQLIGKTNQFNLTTRRHSLEAVREMIAREGAVSLAVRIADRFADYGLVAVLLAVPQPDADTPTLHIDTWLMSCRVIARTVEEFCLDCLVTEACRRGYRRLSGDYLATRKNALVADLYDRLGFARISESSDGVRYVLELQSAATPTTFVKRRE